METSNTSVNKKIYFIIWALCIIGFWSVLPYIQYLGKLPATISMRDMFLLGTAQSAFFFGFICWLSFKLIPKTDLRPFFVDHLLKQIAYPAVLSGVLLSGILFFLNQMVFHNALLSGAVHPPFWAGALASIYGGVNEEVSLRLFLFTLIYFLVGKAIKIHAGNRAPILWGVNLFVALLFGVGHLPALFKLIHPSVLDIFRVVFLNGIAGVVFGWLYWSRGLWTAMAAHFIADLMLHAFLI
jgi:membrane protease YdiL (CAAX protease family)